MRRPAYALAPECIPEPLEVILGISSAIVSWPSYEDPKNTVPDYFNNPDAQQIFEKLAERIRNVPAKHKQKVIAIDGVGGSGKSSFAKFLQRFVQGAEILHVDDFYKPKSLRVPGTDFEVNPNFDWDRYESEVIRPIESGTPIKYRIYDWEQDSLNRVVEVPLESILIIEGGFSTQERFRSAYDFKIWIDTPEDIRVERAIQRDGEHMRHYWEDEWVPVERNYIQNQNPVAKADLVFKGYSS